MQTYLVIDVGTSSTKLSLYDGEGRLLAAREAAYLVEVPRAGWAEQDPQAWWQAVCRLGPQVLSGAQVPSAIVVSGQTPLCAPVDANGVPLRKAILWLDRRATPQAAWLADHLGAQRCQQAGANRLDSYFGGLKWLWYRQEEPQAFARTWKILQANSYVIWQLTGQAVIDPSQAGLCSPCFDFAAGSWNAEICGEMGMPLEMLPEIHPSHAVVGQVTQAAARASGLPAGTPVVCGGGDFACSCLGAGVTGRGTAALMLGTAGNLLFPGVFNPDARLLHTHHVTGQPLTFGGVLAGGNLSWFAGLFGEPSARLYAQLDAEAANLPPGSEGLIYLPYLMGERTPIWDPEARGAFVGLSSRHTRGHLYRAVLEGVAFAFRQIVEINGRAGLEAIVAIDGGARSPVWRGILAAVLGVPLRQGSSRSGTGLGAAYLAALATGQVSGFESIANWTETSGEDLPDPFARARYDQLNPIYAGLYPKLKDDFHALG
jgi:sugar (pentulose or hexulose) kinase